MISEYWGILLLVGFGLLIYCNHSPSYTPSHSGFSRGHSSTGNEPTFEVNESTSIGNPDENSVLDTPQVIDDSIKRALEMKETVGMILRVLLTNFKIS